jgi:hypothetical protein
VPNAPLKVKDVRVTTSAGANQSLIAHPEFHALDTTSIAVQFNRYILPTAASRQGVCLQTEIKDVRSLADCTSSVGALSPAYDPVTRTVTYYLPGRLLEGDYQLTVLNRGDNFGFESFDGVSLDAPVQVLLHIDANADPTAVVEAPPTDLGFCTIKGVNGADDVIGASAVFSGSCSSCHLLKSPDGPVSNMGMVLTDEAVTSIDGLQKTVINVVAHETELGGHAQVPDESPSRFGVSMPRVAPGEPGNSYLMYKILANPALNDDLHEADRLRAGFVVGHWMPVGKFEISLADAEVISRWIAAGAQTPSCPE